VKNFGLASLVLVLICVNAVASETPKTLLSCSKFWTIASPQVGDRCENLAAEIFEWTGATVFKDGGWKDSTGLVWTASYAGVNSNPDSLSIAEAQNTCANLGARLPTKNELIRAATKEFFYSPLDAHYNDLFWTSTASVDYSGKACTFSVEITDNKAGCFSYQTRGAAFCVK
jgi:hypothetical protein